MTQINAYITFSGNCRKAMGFYQECLGGDLVLQTVGESPMANQWPAHLQHGILHGSLTNNGIVILGSDMSGPAGVTKGNNVSLSLSCDTEQELNTYFAKLSADGTINHPLSDFFAGKIGNLTDKYGIAGRFSMQKTTPVNQIKYTNKLNYMKKKTIKKSIAINAPKEAVWEVLLQDKYNRQWYAPFSPGTKATTDWQLGSRATFTDDSNAGITGIITENKPGEILAIEYDGEVVNNVEVFDSPMAKAMKGSKEMYILAEKDGHTLLDISLDMGEEYFDMMSEQWEKALEIIKELAEKQKILQ